MAADPSTGTIPTRYFILNVTTGHIKRHAGGRVWEVTGRKVAAGSMAPSRACARVPLGAIVPPCSQRKRLCARLAYPPCSELFLMR